MINSSSSLEEKPSEKTNNNPSTAVANNNYKCLLSFTIHNILSSSGADVEGLQNTFNLLNCSEFNILQINDRMIGVEINQANFANVRKVVFDAILNDFPNVLIEPKDVDHVFFKEHEAAVKLEEGALCLDDVNGFRFYSAKNSIIVDMDLKDLNCFSDGLLELNGKFVLYDEAAMLYVLIVKNCKKWNSYARLGSGDIPEAFHKFRMFHTKLSRLQEVDEMVEDEMVEEQESDEIKYYMNCVQDQYPLVRFTPTILSLFKEGLKKLAVSNSFSDNSLGMSVYTGRFLEILQTHPFSNEDQLISLMNSSLKCFEYSRNENRFIRAITLNYRNERYEYQIGLPELAGNNVLFNKLGANGFVKVKVIGNAPPSEIVLQGKTYLPVVGFFIKYKQGELYYYDTSVYESEENIISQLGESVKDQVCEEHDIVKAESGYLTPSMIHTLISFGIEPSIIQSMFEEWFNLTVNNLVNQTFLLDLLKKKCDKSLPAVSNLTEIPEDLFIQDLLRHLVSSYLNKIQTKLVIPAQKSITTNAIVDQCLKEDQVMVLFGNDKYLEDGTTVLVCKEPCLSQKDLKLFTVKNDETLKNKYQSNHPLVILPNSMGSEHIFAFWDGRVIPTLNNSTTTIENHQKLTSLRNDFLMNQVVDGWIAIAEKEGAKSAKACELAALVNEISNGNTVKLPSWFSTIEYPDFMKGKPGKSLNSKSILGKIHHRLALMKNIIPKDVSIDLSNVKKGETFEKLEKLNNLIIYLKQVKHCTIFELLTSGGKDIEFIRSASQIEPLTTEEYKNSIENLPKYDILSWIAFNQEENTSRMDLNKQLSDSISRYLGKFRFDQLEKIENKLNGYKSQEKDDIFIVGSLSVLLHDPNETDCDWFIEPVSNNPTFFDDLCHRLSAYFKPIKEEYHKSVPLFRIYLQERDLRFLELIDLTNGDTGFRKKHHMRLYFSQQPKLLLILRIVFDLIKKICSFHVKTFQLTWEVVDFCISRNYIHKEVPPSRQESIDQEKQFSDCAFMKSILSQCGESNNFEKEAELIIEFIKYFKLSNNMEFPDNLDDSKSYSATSEERKIEFAENLMQTCLVNLYLHRDFSKAILPTEIIQKTYEEFKVIDAKPVFRAEARDFIDGSVLTLFKGDLGQSPISFSFYKGHVHSQHAKLPIHRPYLENYDSENNNLISPLYEEKLSSQLMKMEDKPENYVFIMRFGVYYLVNMQKSIFSEITKPENSSVFNECMRKKAKVVKGPSADSFATGVSEISIPLLRPNDSPSRMTEYSVSFYKNVNNKSTEFKVRLDENMKLKTKVISGQLRVISHTFIGKNNDMRFYINHLQYLDENNEISDLVDKLDKKGWLTKQGANDTEIVFNKKLELIKTIRMEERETYTIHNNGEPMELDIVKVKTFNLPQNCKNQTLIFKEEHYEVELTLSNDKIHSSSSCINLINCGIHYWNQFIDK